MSHGYFVRESPVLFSGMLYLGQFHRSLAHPEPFCKEKKEKPEIKNQKYQIPIKSVSLTKTTVQRDIRGSKNDRKAWHPRHLLPGDTLSIVVSIHLVPLFFFV